MIEQVPIFCNNTSAMNMAKNLVHHKRTKHINVRHHFLRDNVEKGHISMKLCKTGEDFLYIYQSFKDGPFKRNCLELGLIKMN